MEKHKGTPFRKDPYDHDAYKQIRLDPSRAANTILASNRHFHPFIPRRLTIHDQAALQSLPDDYWFCGTEGEMQRQVGNAVPPRMAMRLGGSLVDSLAGEVVDSER